MKNISVAIIAIGLIAFSSCSFTVNETKKEAQHAVHDHEHDSKFICPMYCEGSGSDSAGSCPVCKMDYVKNKNYKEKTK